MRDRDSSTATTPKELISTYPMEEKVKYEPEVTPNPATSNLQTVFDIHKHSSKGKLLRTLSWVLRVINNLKASLKNKSVNKENGVSAETDSAEMVLIKSIQSKAFNKELHYLFEENTDHSRALLHVSKIFFSTSKEY